MKRVEIIEYGVIAVGLVLGYEAITSVISALVTILIAPDFVETLLPFLLFILIYFTFFFVVLRFRKKIANIINGKSEETVNLKFDKKSILHITLIAVCFIAMISTIPHILIYIFKSFKHSIESYDRHADNFENEGEKYNFWSHVIKCTLAIILLKFSRNIATYFGKDSEGIETINQNPSEETN